MDALPLGHNVVADIASIGALVAVFAGVLPSIATLVTILYFGLLLYDRLKRGPPAPPHNDI